MSRASQLLRYVWKHPSNRGRRVRACVRLAAWQIWKRATGRPWDVRLSGGTKLKCYPDSTSASAALYASGRPDYHEMGLMEHYLRPGDEFVDVGANVGVYTLLAGSLVGPCGRVDAVEPGARAVERLRENVERNRLTQVHVHVVAATASDGPVRFQDAADTMNRLIPGKVGTEGVTVAGVKLDDLLSGREPAMGKMDIEGAELFALQGAEGLVARQIPPVWLLEINGCLRGYGLTEEALAGWLRARAYELGSYDADRRVFRLGGTPWKESDNVVALARSRLDHILARTGASIVEIA